jgi:hypothetical protein
MSTLTARLNAVKNENTVKMYSAEGASFQEYAINRLDRKGSQAHMMIGALVTAINNNQITVAEATNRFIAALEN